MTDPDAEYAERIVAKAEEFRNFLNEVEIQGYPKRSTELQRLHELICRYPDEAREMIAELGGE